VLASSFRAVDPAVTVDKQQARVTALFDHQPRGTTLNCQV
jgi:hypothetical protein